MLYQLSYRGTAGSRYTKRTLEVQRLFTTSRALLGGRGTSIYSPMPRITFAGRSIDLPRSRLLRIVIGIGLILFGLLGFLPVLGFWMVPLGLIVLSIDIPAIRRGRRRTVVRLGQWLKRRHPSLATRLGFGSRRKRRQADAASGRRGCDRAGE